MISMRDPGTFQPFMSCTNFVNFVEREHDRRNCRSKNRVYLADLFNEPLHARKWGAVIQIALNDNSLVTMLDSGVQQSIVEKITLILEFDYSTSLGDVHGVGAGDWL